MAGQIKTSKNRVLVPLGGTTLFFRRAVLEDLGGWDAHNVTEDADLGLRLARRGYRTELVDTVTEEEPNARLLPWIRQRSRWQKGFWMTWASHMRDPRRLMRDLGAWRFFGVQVLFLGSLSQAVLAPVLWSFWLLAFGLPHPMRAVLPEPALTALVGLFVLSETVSILVGVWAVRGRGHRHLIGWVPTLHLYYPLAAIASWKALYEAVTRPFYWDKTTHGLVARTAAGTDDNDLAAAATGGADGADETADAAPPAVTLAAVPPAAVPPAAVPPTAVPPAAVPPTAVPPAAVPPSPAAAPAAATAGADGGAAGLARADRGARSGPTAPLLLRDPIRSASRPPAWPHTRTSPAARPSPRRNAGAVRSETIRPTGFAEPAAAWQEGPAAGPAAELAPALAAAPRIATDPARGPALPSPALRPPVLPSITTRCAAISAAARLHLVNPAPRPPLWPRGSAIANAPRRPGIEFQPCFEGFGDM